MHPSHTNQIQPPPECLSPPFIHLRQLLRGFSWTYGLFTVGRYGKALMGEPVEMLSFFLILKLRVIIARSICCTGLRTRIVTSPNPFPPSTCYCSLRRAPDTVGLLCRISGTPIVERRKRNPRSVKETLFFSLTCRGLFSEVVHVSRVTPH